MGWMDGCGQVSVCSTPYAYPGAEEDASAFLGCFQPGVCVSVRMDAEAGKEVSA